MIRHDIDIIKEGDKLIAAFLQWQEESEGSWYVKSQWANYVVYSIHNNYPHRDLPFYRSWDWLMKAVETILEMDNMADEEMFNNSERKNLRILQLSIMCPRWAVWEAVVEYINWKNSYFEKAKLEYEKENNGRD